MFRTWQSENSIVLVESTSSGVHTVGDAKYPPPPRPIFKARFVHSRVAVPTVAVHKPSRAELSDSVRLLVE